MNTPRSALIRVWIACIAISSAGCGGTQQTAENSWSEDLPKSDNQPLRETETLEAPTPEPLEKKPEQRNVVSVRSDLGLSPQAATAPCPCLRVAVGSPGEAIFQWFAGLPKTPPDTLAIAVTAAGVECPGGESDESKRRPSISAIDIDGNDVIVEVEELPLGAPQASGALIPAPGPGGSVYVRAREGRGVYARMATPAARCKVR